MYVSQNDRKEESKPPLAKATLASVWAIFGTVYFIWNPLKRLVPIALQPFAPDQGLSTGGWTAYVLCMVFMAYVEGYRGFQLKFSPLVVRRALLLDSNSGCSKQVMAPAYAMALFGANKRRKTSTWILVIGVFLLAALVKKMPYPYRSIVDAGVVVGLGWGIASILLIYVHALVTGRAPDVDPSLPESDMV